MIQEVYIKNYRSIAEARVRLSPFTLLIGANGTGKSNFLKALQRGFSPYGGPIHYNRMGEGQAITLTDENGVVRRQAEKTENHIIIFSIDPAAIAQAEEIGPDPHVKSNGEGAVRVLDALKTGDSEYLFDKIEQKLKEYVPEIEKLSFQPGHRSKKLQVREKHISIPVPVSELSEGTRLVLTILTILHQEKPPKVICLEDIDRGLHPRLFRQIIDFCFQMTEEKGVQIIATTHNPYLLDHFKDDPEAVIIVEKENGETTFTSLADRLEPFTDDEGPLGSLWYGGFVGGVPEKTY